MATHSSVLAWRIPGIGEPGGLQSMGLHRVGHDRSDSAAAAAAVHFLSSFLSPTLPRSEPWVKAPGAGEVGWWRGCRPARNSPQGVRHFLGATYSLVTVAHPAEAPPALSQGWAGF